MSKPRPIFLNAREAIARAEKRLGCVVRPVNPQPPAKWDCVNPIYGDPDTLLIGWSFYSSKDKYDHGHIKRKHIPCMPGDVVPLKEAWGIASTGGYFVDPCLTYKADRKQVCIDPELLMRIKYRHQDGWRSAVNLLPDFVRPGNHATVKSVECKRVSHLDVVELIGTWADNEDTIESSRAMRDAFKAEWLTRYGKKHPWNTSHAFIIKFEEEK